MGHTLYHSTDCGFRNTPSFRSISSKGVLEKCYFCDEEISNRTHNKSNSSFLQTKKRKIQKEVVEVVKSAFIHQCWLSFLL